MNWVDYIIIAIVLFEIYLGWRNGCIDGIFSLITWVGGLLLGFLFFTLASGWLTNATGLSPVWTRPLGFLLVFVAGIIVLGWVSRIVVTRFPKEIRRGRANRLLGILPGIVNGLVTAVIAALLLFTLPLPASITTAVRDSRFAEDLSVRAERMQSAFDPIFGEAVSQALTSLIIPPGTDQRYELPYTVTSAPFSPQLEAQMIDLVNAERAQDGLQPLEADPELREVARAHSTDMFTRGYFGHITPEGLTPFDRIQRAGVSFLIAGENLALAPTLQAAHTGLMNSPGHRANILRPQFGRVGIGIVDGGVRGIMVTQLFRN